MPTIMLIRHGQASFGTADYDSLSSAGLAQADALAHQLRRSRRHVERIVTGSLRRQRQTAAPTASMLGLPTTVDPRLDEYDMDDILANHGDTDARTNAAPGGVQVSTGEFQRLLEAGIRRWLESGSASAAAESWPAFARRTHAALTDLASDVSSGNAVLAFTSAGVIAAVCVSILGVPAETLIALNRVCVNGAITVIASGRSGLSLVSFNEHRYLEDDPETIVTLR